MTEAEFQRQYLELLLEGQEYDLYGYKPAQVLAHLQKADAAAVNIIKRRANSSTMSTTRCHKAMTSEALWQLTTDNGWRFLYFQDGPRRFVFVGASTKVKQKKFRTEIKRAEKLWSEYLALKKGITK